MSTTERFEVAVDGGAVPVFVSAPAEGAADLPGLVVIPSIFGPHDDLLAQMRSLADVGTIVVLDPFWRAPEPDAATNPHNTVAYADHERAIARLGGFDFGACVADVAAVAEWLKGRTNGRLAALGICFGGSFTLLGASSGLFEAAVTWHGSRMEGVLESLGDLPAGPFRFHYGDADPITPPDAIDAVRSHFADHGDAEVIVHAGAEHGFSHEGAAWDPDAAAAGMADLRGALVALA
ncbi:MAG: dienelactone hydrolase family protein [Acidimicrobiales bacterium]